MAVRGYKKTGTHNRNDVRGSDEARAYNRGAKQKELDDALLYSGLGLSLLVGFVIGSAVGSWIVGGVIFFVLFALMGYWYYKE